MLGCWWFDIRTQYVDYSKYLGPEWKKENATYGNSGIRISNHFNWIDPLLLGIRDMPSAICKADIEKIPLIGPMGHNIGCLFFDRVVKDEKRDVVKMTIER
jgi:1-acyl-sn-glycerol-3-phosphate acyltransferase